MIRYIYCIRKKENISLDEFRSIWNSPDFIRVIKNVADYYQATRYSQNLSLKVEMGEVLINKNGLSAPYDATLELFWENANKLDHLYNSKEGEALAEKFRLAEEEFIDLSRSTAFFTIEGDEA